jgi:uncharacterized membrane protein YphA (DoxX/SURF4 family)
MNKQLVGLICRILIGIVFIASAILKYLSIEATDVFLFEHKLLPWTITQFATRLLIAFEAGIGVMLIAGLKPRLTRVLTFLTLILFTVYLLLKPLLFENTDENCHCFGNYIHLNHIQSILKNVVLLLLACFISWAKTWKTRFSSLFIIIIAVLAVSTSFIIYPPDVILTKIYPKNIEVNREDFHELMQTENVKAMDLEKGRKIICMFSTGCKYCKRTAMKLEVMIDIHKLNRQNFATIFWGNEKNITKFRMETHTKPLPTTFVNPILFLKATKGRQPVIVFLNNGKVEQVFNSRTFSETKLVNFLKE